MLTVEQSALLTNWMEAKRSLEAVKEHEANLRHEILTSLFPDAADGVNTLDIGNGWKAKLTAKTNYKLDADKNKVADAENRIANIGNEGSFIAERLFKWKAELSISEYKKLEDTEQQRAIKGIVDSVLTTSPGMPTFEIVEPKS